MASTSIICRHHTSLGRYACNFRQACKPLCVQQQLRAEHTGPQYQPRELGSFYADLLETPLPNVAKATATPDLPEWVASGGRKDIEERAKKLFGSIEGSGYKRQTSDTPDETWQTINGVPIPPRPSEPDNCCMSGCVQ